MTRFLVAGIQRTGTTLIVSTLNNHPDIRCYGELFLFAKGRGKKLESSYRQYINHNYIPRSFQHIFNRDGLVEEYLEQLYNKEVAHATGFKIMLDQSQSFPMVIDYAKKNNIKVLSLIRKNTLKILISRYTAKERKLYHSNAQEHTAKITLPVDGLVKRLKRIKAESYWANQIFDSNLVLNINYEDFIYNKEEELDNILNFLGVDTNVHIKSDLKKINPDKLSQILENYNDVVKVLKETEFEDCLG